MAHADFLKTTLVADLCNASQHSLQFALSEQGPTRNDDPHSTVDQNGAVTNAWDWGIELCDAMGDEEGRVLSYLTMYVLPAEEDIYLVGHSLARCWTRPMTHTCCAKVPTACRTSSA